MKNFLLFLLLTFALSGVLEAQSSFTFPQGYGALDERDLLKKSSLATLQKYPDAQAVLIDDIEVTRVQPDGTSVTVDDYCYKILTDEGGRQLRTLSLSFSTVYERPEVLKAQLLKPDGKIIAVDPKEHCRISIDPSQMRAEIFDPAHRVLLLSFPELKPGDMIRVVFKVTAHKVRMPGSWCDITLFQSTHPTLCYTRIVETPESLPLRSTALKNVPAGCVTSSQEKKNGRLLYVWRAHNLPQLIPEPAMPSLSSCAARLLVSTSGSWEEISKWYADLCRPRLQKITPAMKAKVAELVAGKKSEMEKIRALNDYVSRTIRYTGITAEAAAPGYEPHDVSLTFERGHGVCRDKAALLTAMLNIAGIPGRMVLIMAGDPKDAEVPNTYFNHAVVAVERKDHSYLLMDPTSEKNSELFPAYLANCSYLPARAEGETLLRSPVESSEKHTLKVSTKLSLNLHDRLSGETTILPSGLLEQIYRSELYNATPEMVRRAVASRISSEVPGIDITSLSVEPADLRDTGKPLKITFHFTAGDYLRSHTSVQPIPLPRFSLVFGLVDNFLRITLLPERRYPLKVTPRKIIEEFSMTLPKDVLCSAIPEDFQAELPGICRFSTTMKRSGRQITGTTLWNLEASEIQPADYSRLLVLLRQLNRRWERPLLVQQQLSTAEPSIPTNALFAGDNFVIPLQERSVQLALDGSWTESFHESRLLLKSGEGNLRFSYYEPLENVEISGFTVSLTGKKIPLSANEIKRMDAPWSAGSTRYPGGKILTVSFPGAEPGAKIEYTLKRKVSGRPFFSAVLPAQGEISVLKRKFELSVPTKSPMRRSPETLGFSVTEKKYPDQRLFSVAIDSFLRIPWEPLQPSPDDFQPALRFSNGNYREYCKILTHALRQSVALRGQGIRDLAALIRALPPEKRLRQLQQTAARSFRSINAPLNRMRIDRFADPETTLRSGEASSADRAVFIAALLEELQIDYRFVAVSDEPFTSGRIRTLNTYPEEIFTGILLYLPKENIYLNDTGEYGLPGAARHEGKTGLDLATGYFRQIVPKPGFETARRIDCRVNFAPVGFGAKYFVRCQFSGNAFEGEAKRFASMTPLFRELYFKKMANNIARGGTIIRSKVDFDQYPGFWELTLDVPECGTEIGEYRCLTLPLFGQLSREMNHSSERRRTPCLNASPIDIRYSCEVNLPPGYRILRLRSDRSNVGRAGLASYMEEYTLWGRGFFLYGRLQVPVYCFPPGEYRYLSEISHYLHQPDSQQIIYVKNGE